LLVTLNQAADRKGYATLDDIQQGLNTVNPEPRWGDIQDDNDPGADFLLLTPNRHRPTHQTQLGPSRQQSKTGCYEIALIYTGPPLYFGVAR
jgi:hypothetical protein